MKSRFSLIRRDVVFMAGMECDIRRMLASVELLLKIFDHRSKNINESYLCNQIKQFKLHNLQLERQVQCTFIMGLKYTRTVINADFISLKKNLVSLFSLNVQPLIFQV